VPFTGHTPAKVDGNGRLIPDEVYCHVRSHLSCTLDQESHTKSLSNPAERERKELWWFERDGSNMTEAVENICLCFTDAGERGIALFSIGFVRRWLHVTARAT